MIGLNPKTKPIIPANKGSAKIHSIPVTQVATTLRKITHWFKRTNGLGTVRTISPIISHLSNMFYMLFFILLCLTINGKVKEFN